MDKGWPFQETMLYQLIKKKKKELWLLLHTIHKSSRWTIDIKMKGKIVKLLDDLLKRSSWTSGKQKFLIGYQSTNYKRKTLICWILLEWNTCVHKGYHYENKKATYKPREDIYNTFTWQILVSPIQDIKTTLTNP